MPRGAEITAARAALRRVDRETERFLSVQGEALQVFKEGAGLLPADDLIRLAELLAQYRQGYRRLSGLSAALSAQVEEEGGEEDAS